MMHASVRPGEITPAKLTLLYRKQFALCNVKRGETIVLITDLGTRPEHIESAFAAAEEFGADIYEMRVSCMPVHTKAGVPTIGKCKGTLEAICAADMAIIYHVPLFTKWLKMARQAGTRFLLVNDSPDDLERLMAVKGMKEAVLHAEQRYKKTKKVQVTSEAGTDLIYSVGGYPVMSQYGYVEEPGRYDRWGGGLIHTFPNEGSSNGTVVFQPGDIIILPYCRYVVDPVKLEIRDGFITKIDGGLDAKLMRDWLTDNQANEKDRDPFAVSHLGWGMNPQALWYGIALNGDDPERHRGAARTFPGNFLFSTGPNTQGGGTRNTLGHYDVPMRDCTIALDGDVIIERGRIVDKKMLAERLPL
jgi:2,5-dihydroxypyridine 5,6-dioxygenase